MEQLLDKLNDKQKEAVTATEGAVLVIAGAGSGKTTVIVNRIAYIIAKKHVSPQSILAITFTNKAANEMKTRVEKLLGENVASGMWIGTFHRMCVRILRSKIDLLGYGRDFVIYDSADTRTLIKECLRELELDEKNYPPRAVASIISNAKNQSIRDMCPMAQEIHKLYQRKKQENIVNTFDDMCFFVKECITELKLDEKKYFFKALVAEIKYSSYANEETKRFAKQAYVMYRQKYSRDNVFNFNKACNIIRACLLEMHLDESIYLPEVLVLIADEDIKKGEDTGDPKAFAELYRNDLRMSKIAEIYKLYQAKLKEQENNALDFDDIIRNTVKILIKDSGTRFRYQDEFKYILVDEYQDTNNVQYQLVKMLAAKNKNICVVGDDDQSIYKFRGANIENILSFGDDYKSIKKIFLEQNYRSTQNILSAANRVIANNRGRMGKNLWTVQADGEKIKTYTGMNEHEEAQFIANEIKKHKEAGGKFSDCAVLYRMNAQSRVIEDMLRSKIPYRVLAGLRFYDRKEIKDMIAYLRVIQNPNDALSLKRIINEPKRKIGGETMEKVQRIADENNAGIFSVVREASMYDELKRSASSLGAFADMLEQLIKAKERLSVPDLIEKTLKESGYKAALEAEGGTENKTRLDNIEEFISVAMEYAKSEEYDGSLLSFLESVTLVSDVDGYDENEDTAVLMTIHSAKGLEFDTVFIAGMEEGLFPGMRSMNSDDDIEEERRLCYVAMTRAKKHLYITKTTSRMLYGRTVPSQESRFFREIPSEFTEDVSGIKEKIYDAAQKTGFVEGYGKKEAEHSYKRSKPLEETFASSPKPSANIDFSVGDRVNHVKFGAGTIVSAKSYGSDTMLEVNFDTIGRKVLMAAFAKMKKI